MRIAKSSENVILSPFKMYAEYADGASLYAWGDDESDCLMALAERCDEHGEMQFYTGVTDAVYDCGELMASQII